MNRDSLNLLQVQWLLEPEAAPVPVPLSLVPPALNGQARSHLPALLPSGYGWVNRLILAADLDIYQSVHRSIPHYLAATNLGHCAPALGQHTMSVQLLHGASTISLHTELVADRRRQPRPEPVLAGALLPLPPLQASGKDVVMTELVVSEVALQQLVGDVSMRFLLHSLDLDARLAQRSVPLPPHVTAPLRECLDSGCTGALHLLFAQSKILEFLWRLASYTQHGVPALLPSSRAAGCMPALHAYLSQLQGHTPTLKELGVKFGESPQSLNAAFVQAYGESIFSMLTNYRLDQSHAALLDSKVAIKTLAARLGYSHSNHFAYAFKQKFGYTPGSLRRPQPPLQA